MAEDDLHKQPTLPNDSDGENTPQQLQEVPKQIGPYPILALLDKGSMSYLYLGQRPDGEEPITVKVLSPKFLSEESVVDRFFQEAEIIALADHPNVVKLYGHGQWDHGLYIAMEFVRGLLLRELIIQKPPSLKKSLEIALQICKALSHLHSNGIIHRDLKPENILLTPDGLVKVIDFGIAQLLNAEGEGDRREDSLLIGTPIYMSPEQKERPSQASYPSDIYSLGIILYELFTKKMSKGRIQLGALPEGLQEIIAKALKENVEERYGDIIDFMLDLKRFSEEFNSAEDSPLLGQEESSTDPSEADSTEDTESQEVKENSPEANEVPPMQLPPELAQLSEQLKEAQATLVPQTPPHWSTLEVGLVNHVGSGVTGVYYDFFELKGGSFGILMGEAAAKGIQGVIYSSVLRGMVRSLSWSASKPVELVAYLNDLLINDTIDQIFTISYLIVNPKENQLHFVSCGYGNLWYIPSGSDKPQKITADNIALGIDPEAEFMEVTHGWDVGDTLMMNTFRAIAPSHDDEKGVTEKAFQSLLKKHAYLAPQKQVDAVFAKVCKKAKQSLEERPVTLISMKRNG